MRLQVSPLWTLQLTTCLRTDGLGQLSSHNQRQAISNTDMGVFKFPWEKGRLAKIFANEPAVKLKVPKLQPSSRNLLQMSVHVDATGSLTAKPVLQADTHAASRPIFLDVVRSTADVAEPVDRDETRTQALKAWWTLLAHDLTSSAVGRKVTVEANFDNVVETALAILDATFAVKSPGTLMRRVYSVQAYEDWCAETLGKHWLPVDEFSVWQYVRHLQATKAPATKASSLVEALRFCWFLLGCEGCDEAEQSLRVKGLSSQLRAQKKPWRPADLLTVAEVKEIHKVLNDEDAALGDRCLAGHLLHLLYSRSRWSDLKMVTAIYMDPEAHYLEVATRCHKSARGAEQKSRLLPIVCPCLGVDNTNWAQTYFKVRQLANLSLPMDGAGPMMCCPTNATATTWTSRALTSEEGSDFMRKLLRAPKTPSRRISSHSLKSTLMSWTAKYGLSEHSRAVLARHASTAASATAVYSRDLLSPILREMNLVLGAIRTGAFCPDTTRSGMLTPGALPYMGGTPLPGLPMGAPSTPVPDVSNKLASNAVEKLLHPNGAREQAGDDVAGDESAGALFGSPLPSAETEETGALDNVSETTEENSVQSSSQSESEETSEEPRRFVEIPADYVINVRSLVLHVVKSPGQLACGRKLTPSYTKIYELNGIRCSRCFNV